MKRNFLIQHLKKAGIVASIALGMLLLTIHTTSALTDSGSLEASAVSEESTDASASHIEQSESASSTEYETTASNSGASSTNSSADSTSSDSTIQSPADSTKPDSSGSTSSGSETSGQEVTDPSASGSESTGSGSANSGSTNSGSSNSESSNPESSNIEASGTDASGSETSNSESSSSESSDSAQSGSNSSTSDSETSNQGANDSANSNSAVSDTKPSDSNTKNPSSDTTSKAPAAPVVNTSSEEVKTYTPKKPIQDNKKEAVYVSPTFVPSASFLELSRRIPYNEALPIDGIPSFITQEMVTAALKCQDETGFPASVTVAQIIQESGYGKYGPGGNSGRGLSYLAYQYCNLFGIKGTGPAGSVNMRTGEQSKDGSTYTIQAGFRVYHTFTECIEDRTALLKRAYADLIYGAHDANTFAMRIGSRWATSLTYGQNLIAQMRRYDLYRLDSMTLEDFSDMIGTFAHPCPGSYITSGFGYRKFDESFHKGIDFGTRGSVVPTYAAMSGTVVIAGWDDSAGNWVVIDHGNGLVTKYMHHSRLFVKKGDHVEKGQQIGLTGSTGNSTGIHLHFQVEENGTAVDAEAYLQE